MRVYTRSNAILAITISNCNELRRLSAKNLRFSGGNSLDIVVGRTSEVLNATVVHPGQARVPCAVFRGIARTLRFYRGKFVTIAFLAGALRVDRTGYRHSSISVLVPCREHALVG